VDRQDFLKTLAEACQNTGWEVPAYCLMSNHYQRCEVDPFDDAYHLRPNAATIKSRPLASLRRRRCFFLDAPNLPAGKSIFS